MASCRPRRSRCWNSGCAWERLGRQVERSGTGRRSWRRAAKNPGPAWLRHWAFQPVVEPPLPDSNPAAASAGWEQAPLDQFVYAELAKRGITPSAPADRRARSFAASPFDLVGLPPRPEEIEAFVADTSPEAYPRLVDRLLASPQYGERWGRHWLDVARYADSRGYLAGAEDRRYPFAYTYRDWVVDALNNDMPYDQFLTIEQLAADCLPQPNDKANLAALGFLTLGRRFLNNPARHHRRPDRRDLPRHARTDRSLRPLPRS